MELFVNPDDARGKSTQVYDQLRNAILAGHLEPGSRIASTRSVAETLGVARTTVSEAYTRLSAEGLIEGRRGGGSRVIDVTPTMPSVPAPAGIAPTMAANSIVRYGPEEYSQRPAYDFTAGKTDPNLFPLDAWRRSIRRSFREPSWLNGYGHPGGSARIRGAVSQWITQSRG